MGLSVSAFVSVARRFFGTQSLMRDAEELLANDHLWSLKGACSTPWPCRSGG